MRTFLVVALSLISYSSFAQDTYNVVCYLSNGSRKPLAECRLSNWSEMTRIENTKANATYDLDMSKCQIDASYKTSDYSLFLNYIQVEDNKDSIEVSAYVTTGQGTSAVVTEQKQHVFQREDGIFYLDKNAFKLDNVNGKEVSLSCGDSVPIESPKAKKIRF